MSCTIIVDNLDSSSIARLLALQNALITFDLPFYRLICEYLYSESMPFTDYVYVFSFSSVSLEM